VTFQYSAPQASVAPDAFQLAAPAQPREAPRRIFPSSFQTFRVPARSGVVGFRLTFEDFGGGLAGGDAADFEEFHDALSASELHSWDSKRLTLSFLTQKQAMAITNAPYRVCSANIFGTLAVGAGGGGAVGLFRETSATDPTLINTGYNLTGSEHVTCLHPVIIGGAASPVRLLVGRRTSPMDVLSDLGSPPTIAGSGVTATSSIYGAIQTPLPDLPILLYNSALQVMKSTDNIGANPTVTLSATPWGGYALGLLSLAGARLRAWWVWPRTGSDIFRPLAALKPGAADESIAGQIVSTNLEGTDATALTVPLARVVLALIIRDGIVCSDGYSIYFTDGRQRWFLPFPPDVPANSDRRAVVQGFYRREDDLFVEVNEIATPTGSGNTVRYVLRYDWSANRFHQVTTRQTLSTTGVLSVPGDSLPVSTRTGFFHSYADGNFHRFFQPPSQVAAFAQRQTSGAQANSGQQFEASGTAKTPPLWLPAPYAGLPFAVKRIRFRGDVDSGGAAGTEAAVDITAGGVKAYFRPGWPNQAQTYEVPDEELNPVYQLQVQVDMARSAANTRLTPNALPFDVEGYIFTEETKAPMYQVENDA
jgi:hypothetical protein